MKTLLFARFTHARFTHLPFVVALALALLAVTTAARADDGAAQATVDASVDASVDADTVTTPGKGSKEPVKKVEREKVLEALSSELTRNVEQLRLPEYEAPYFLAYQVKQIRSLRVEAKYGSLVGGGAENSRLVYVEARVGDYQFDNTADTGRDGGFSWPEGYQVGREAPVDDDIAAIRNTLWLITDSEYKQALADFHKRKGEMIYGVKEADAAPSFTKEKPATFIGPEVACGVDASKWKDLARRLSARFRAVPEIFDSQVRVSGDHVTRWFVNSEGTKILTEETWFGVFVSAVTRADDGMLLENDEVVYVRSLDELPDEKALNGLVDKVVQSLRDLRAAPAMDPYTGPAILAARATGVLFHEAVGHRLEGHRQEREQEGRTFKDQVGKPVIPEFISLYDDPTLARYRDESLNGFYGYDEEGVKAQRVTLIDRGVLKNYLLSRQPVKGFSQSNGHGRSSHMSKPTARMAVTIVEAEKAVSAATLKQRLIDEVKKAGKPYGLFFKDIQGGNTNTSSYGFQAFKGSPRMVYRVYPDGREELVRGVEMVGTPLTSINKIVLAGDTSEVFNGYCGAESGWVPVSAIAPPVLLSEIEVQRVSRDAEKPPILPSPWSGGR